MKLKRLLMAILLMICTMFATNIISEHMSCGKVYAASKKKTNKKAMKAYKRLLKNTSYDKFALADINRDGVKELFICDESGMMSDQLYVYKSGKVVKVDDYSWAWGIGFYSNKKYIYAERVGMFDDIIAYYRLNSNGKIIELARRSGEVTFNGNRKVKYTYIVKGKEVTKKKYNSYVKKLKKKAKKLELKYHENTSKNRKKYF